MDLRHLRCFMAVAEEQQFSRAAERLHIEPSPLSRTIKELEEELGVLLFKRGRRGTHLTHPGQVFMDEVRRVFTVLDHATNSVKSAASGYRGTLRIALSNGVLQPRLAAILARCRADYPDIDVRLSEVPLAAQLRGLRDETFDAGFSLSCDTGESIVAMPVWVDPLVIAIPLRHPLLAHKEVPLDELLRYPLIMCHPETHAGYNQQIQRILRHSDTEPIVVEHVTSKDLMLTLVAAGYGLGVSTAGHIAFCRHPEVASRPLVAKNSSLTTYLLVPDSNPSQHLQDFIERVKENTEKPTDM